MIIVPPREWYKTILIQLQFEYVFIFILVVEKNGKSSVYSSSWMFSSDGFCCCVYFLLLYWGDWMRNCRLFEMKKQLVLIYLLWWLLFLYWMSDALDSMQTNLPLNWTYERTKCRSNWIIGRLFCCECFMIFRFSIKFTMLQVFSFIVPTFYWTIIRR